MLLPLLMPFLLLASLLSAVPSLALAAPAVELAPDAPARYVVRPGDTLWDVAGRFLREPWRWPEVWDGNPDIADPDRLHPGDVLQLSHRDGRPRVGIAPQDGELRTVKLRPRVRVTELDRAIPAIPVNAVAAFLQRPVVTDPGDIDDAPYVVGFPSGRLLAGAGDAIHVRRLLVADGDRYEVLRPGQAYRDPETGEVLGFEEAFVASARLERVGDPAILQVTASRRAVQIGDRIRSARDAEPLRSFTPRPAPRGLRGRIIAVLNGVTQIGQYDVVVLNRGSRDALEPGHVLSVYRGGELQRDQVKRRRADWNWRNQTPLDAEFWLGDWEFDGWNRDRPDANAPLPLHRRTLREDATYVAPDQYSGDIMVFRVFPRVSFALVMRATQAMHVGETVSAPRGS
ncbi:LysM peptidoglycan-binding domain-containing protein [Thiohalocapsa marina]